MIAAWELQTEPSDLAEGDTTSVGNNFPRGSPSALVTELDFAMQKGWEEAVRVRHSDRSWVRSLHCHMRMVQSAVLGGHLRIAHRVVKNPRCTLDLPCRRGRSILLLKSRVAVSSDTVGSSCELRSADRNEANIYLWDIVEDPAGSS